ncbi:MAG: tRNA (guanosine(37)-N1)-methyltransferase TrmD [Gammaproteobacteria bacterium]|nr:tRNA (guanosine(37)-N1)-methyltransferase TrmD [Gammaproteobacteria bacterium]
MNITVVTLFPDWVSSWADVGVTGRAIQKDLAQWSVINPRDFCHDDHGQVDDRPYGGGPGMVMKFEPMHAAIEQARTQAPVDTQVIALTPQGEPFNQSLAHELTTASGLVLVAGRYEGMDERIVEHDIDREISIGDYVLSGGELGAMVIADAVLRLLPGVVGEAESLVDESFEQGRLDYPHYTRPDTVDGAAVPEVLMSGNHQEIAQWRQCQAVIRTYQRRPDLLDRWPPSDTEQAWIEQWLESSEQKPAKPEQSTVKSAVKSMPQSFTKTAKTVS